MLRVDKNTLTEWLLDPVDLALAEAEGNKRQDGKESAGMSGGSWASGLRGWDPRNGHIYGASGELAVCRVLGLDPVEQWAQHGSYEELDDGADVTTPEWTLEVKTRSPGGDYALQPYKGKEHFKADYGALVWREKGSRLVQIVGYFDHYMWLDKSRWLSFGPNLKRYGYNAEFRNIKELKG